MSMKTVRSAITEYDLEVPKSIEALKSQLLVSQSYQSSNNISFKQNDPDVLPFHLSDSSEDENEPDVPPLNTEDSDKEYNQPDVPHLPSTNDGDADKDTQLTLLPPVDSSEKVKTRDDIIVTYRGSAFDFCIQVRKFFEVLGWFSGEVVDYFLDGQNNQMYNIIFTDGKE